MAGSRNSLPLIARSARALKGRAAVPGDKSVSHRALILGAMAVGETRIAGLLEADDVLHTAEAMRKLGADVTRDGDWRWRVHGVGVGGFSEPEGELDFGNSGTGCRLTMGAVATTPINRELHRRRIAYGGRPMKRVLEPLSLFGAEWTGRDGGFAPLTLTGARTSDASRLHFASAIGAGEVGDPAGRAECAGAHHHHRAHATRDHTERMLRAFGVDVRLERLSRWRSDFHARRSGIEARRYCRAGRSIVGGVSAGGGADRAGIGYRS